MGLAFAKMHGAGNDFVMVEGRGGAWERWLEEVGLGAAEAVRRLCDRKRGVGTDGLIVARQPTVEGADVKMEFWNADGSRAAMCGNGGRCLARFAMGGTTRTETRRDGDTEGEGESKKEEARSKKEGAKKSNGAMGERGVVLETDAGVLGAVVGVGGDEGTVRLELPPPTKERLDVRVRAGGREWRFDSVDSGVPHAVHFLEAGEELESLDVDGTGRAVRWDAAFAPSGTNVDFARVEDGGRRIRLRTYERGVEGETDACGTGAVATAVLARRLGLTGEGGVAVAVRSGVELRVDFEGGRPWLTGPAVTSFRGEVGGM